VDFQQYTDPDGEIPRRLLAAASEAFAQHGYALTRIREIVRTADVNLAAVNYYFGGKEGLYAATVKQLAQQRAAENSGLQDAKGGDDAAGELYRRVLAILTRFIGGGNSPLGRILAHESMNPTPHFEQLTSEIVRPELEGLGAIVKRLAGDAIAESAMQRAAMSIMGQCLFYLFARRAIDRIYPGSVRSREDCESLARHITDFSLAGIARMGRVSSSADNRS
jgi:TetR/AcrR family transcriptional regulator, regulator of cefoperazone and chloramphenicol sensitivity